MTRWLLLALVGPACASMLGCAVTRVRPEILSVRDPDKLCRVVAFSRCDAPRPGSAFVDTGDVTAVLGL